MSITPANIIAIRENKSKGFIAHSGGCLRSRSIAEPWLKMRFKVLWYIEKYLKNIWMLDKRSCVGKSVKNYSITLFQKFISMLFNLHLRVYTSAAAGSVMWESSLTKIVIYKYLIENSFVNIKKKIQLNFKVENSAEKYSFLYACIIRSIRPQQ